MAKATNDIPATDADIPPSDATNGEAEGVGVYVCHCGGNIADVVDVARVTEVAGCLPGVVVARENPFMCSDPGQKLIAEDIAGKGVRRVVVAACSPSLHEITFRKTLARAGANPYLYEHANIREQVSWCSKSDARGATDKAVRLVSAAVGKARRLVGLTPIRVEARPHVAVIGGGVSGLRCAASLAQRGMKVTVLERAAFLGGRMAQLDRVYPTEASARDLLHRLVEQVVADENISVLTSAEVVSATGSVGDFTLGVRLHPRGVTPDLPLDRFSVAITSCPEMAASAFDYGLAARRAIYRPYDGCYPPEPAIDWERCTRCGDCVEAVGSRGIDLEAQPEKMQLQVGAIVLATGFDPYTPQEGEYGFGKHEGVITLPQLMRLLDTRGPTGGALTRGDRPVRNVCFIHCVGSRQVEGIHQPGPDGTVNNYCSRFCCTATLRAAREVRRRFPQVSVFDCYQDIRTYGRGHEDYYEEASKLGVVFFRWVAEEPPVVERAADGASPLVVRVKDKLTFGEEVEVPADLVVLSTGMVPHDIAPLVEMLKLPRSADRFLQEVHPKLRPVELAVNGVMIAGTCQAPMDITESCAAASAAAAKASALLSKGYVELHPFVAKIDPSRCAGGATCQTECVDECAYARAISICAQGDGKVAQVNAALCTGCGMCVPVCPQGAIEVEGWRLDQFEAMVDALVADY
jgi:heterodisulfide reductase subunit A